MRFCPMALFGILPLLLLLSPYNAGVEGAKKGKKHAVENGGTKDIGIQVGGEEIEKELQKPEGQTSKSAGLGTFHPRQRPLSTSLSGRQSSLRGHIGGGENAVVGDVNSRTIFVPNLSYDVDSKELREYFARFGGVEKAFVGNTRPGWGRVTMKDANVVANILKYPNRVIHGRKSHFRQNIPVKMRKKSETPLRFRKPLDASSQEFVSSPLGKFKTIAAYHGIDVRESPKSAAAAEQQKSQFPAASAGDIAEREERAENAENAENAEIAAEKAESAEKAAEMKNADDRPPMGADERAEIAEKAAERAESAGENAEAESAYEGPPMAADDADTAGDNSNLSGFKAGSEAGAEIKHPSEVDLPPIVVESARKKSWAEMVREEEEDIKEQKEPIVEGQEKVLEEKEEEDGENPWETVVKKRRGSGSAIKREGKGKNTNFVEGRKAAPNVVGEEGKEIKKTKLHLPPLVIPPPPVESLAQKVKEEKEAIKGKETAVKGEEKAGKQIKKTMATEVEEQWETVVKKRRGSGSGIRSEGKGKNTNFVEAKSAPIGEEGKDGSSRQKAIEEGRRIFIGKLPSTIKHDDVRDYFQQFGPIAQITIKDPKEPGAHGIAFVNMANRKEAEDALKSNKKPIIGGHQVVLDLARY